MSVGLVSYILCASVVLPRRSLVIAPLNPPRPTLSSERTRIALSLYDTTEDRLTS